MERKTNSDNSQDFDYYLCMRERVNVRECVRVHVRVVDEVKYVDTHMKICDIVKCEKLYNFDDGLKILRL